MIDLKLIIIRKDLIVIILYRISRGETDLESPLQYFDYVVFIKYVDIPAKLREIETKLHISESTQNWLKLVKLEIVVIILAHVAGCIFLRIGLSELSYHQSSWLKKFELTQLTIKDLYLVSLYYMVISMVTIGYGDIFPATMYERTYVIIVALLATNVCAYSFSQISEIVKFEQNKKESFNQMMINLNDQMNMSGLSMQYQQRVRKFFEHHYYTGNKQMNLTEQIVDKLPVQLRNEVLLDMNKDLINQIQLFKILSPKCIEQISSTIKQKILLPDEILIQQNSNNECLYYINKGFLEVFTTLRIKDDKLQQKNVFRLKNKDVLGYEGFLLGQNNSFGVRSQGTTVVSYIDKQSFLDIVKQFPSDYEKISFERDRTLYGQTCTNPLKLKCISCSSYEHQFSNCPYISYTRRYKPCDERNQRKNFDRKRKRSQDVLKDFERNKEQAMYAYAANRGSIIMDAISQLNDQHELQISFDNTASLSSSESEQNENIKERESITSSQANNILPQLNKTQSQNQYQQQAESDEKIKQQLLQGSKDHPEGNDQSQKVTQRALNSSDFSSDNNQTQARNQEYKKRKRKAQTYNQENEMKRDSQLKRNSFANQHMKSQSSTDVSPLNKKYSKTTDLLQKQKKLSQIVSKVEMGESREQNNNNKRQSKLEKDTQSQKLLNQVYERRQRKASRMYEYQQQAFVERIQQQQRQPVLNQISSEEIVGNTLQEILMRTSKNQYEPIQEQNSLKQPTYIQILSQLQIKQQESFKQIENKDLIKECIDKRSKEFIQQQPSEKQLNQNTQLFGTTSLSPNDINKSVAQQVLSPLLKNQQKLLDNSVTFEQMIRCQQNLQDLDMLIIRKRYMLLQQQNKNNIENHIEVPDNEMDIDTIQSYRYYYSNQNAKQILLKIKSKQNQNAKQKDRISITKKGQNSKKKINRKSVPSSKPSEKQLSKNYSYKTTTVNNQNFE